MNNKDYYKVLNVKKNASSKEIKDAYKRLIIKWHPDRHIGKNKKEAEEKATEINEAYSIIGNEKKRKEYDSFKEGYSSFQGSSKSRSFDFNDIFENFFGKEDEENHYSDNNEKYNKDYFKKKGKDILVKIKISLKESILGIKKKFSIDLEENCNYCEKIKCNFCKGKGIINIIRESFFGSFQSKQTCSDCQGKGIINKNCNFCKGKGMKKISKEIKINIPKGLDINKKLRYKKIGNDGLNGGEKGDIYVEIEVENHEYFRRKNNNIHVDLPISFLDAILGGIVKLITLEGIENIKIPVGSQNDDFLILEEKGCYYDVNSLKRGDFYIWLKIKFPRQINESTKNFFNNLRKETNWNPNLLFIEKYKNI